MCGHKQVFPCGQRCNYIVVIKRDTDCGKKDLRMIAGWREESYSGAMWGIRPRYGMPGQTWPVQGIGVAGLLCPAIAG